MKSTDISDKIKECNDRLQAGCLGVSILQRGQKLYIRSSLFPPKPGSDKTEPHRQEVATGCFASVAGLREAEGQARLISGQLQTHTFAWEPWSKVQLASEKPKLVSDWISELKAEVLSVSQNVTWRKDYAYTLAKLPQDEPLTGWMLRKLIQETPMNTKSRKRVVTACNRIARLAKLEDAVFSNLSGNYGIKSTAERVLPSDKEIEKWYGKITKARDRWIYGMLAVYGIRPHEIFWLDLEAFRFDQKKVRVLNPTKTGERWAYSFRPQWVEKFQLAEIQEVISKGRDNSTKGQNVGRWFNRHHVPFQPYDLRHAWAVYCIHLNVSDTIAAKMMGHSVAVHQKTYQHWLQSRDYEQAVAVAIGSGKFK
jgi:integrase